MDWDRVNATDIFVLLNSVVPSGGSLNCVTGMVFSNRNYVMLYYVMTININH